MISAINRLKNYLTEQPNPSAAFQISRSYVSGIHFSRKERRFGGHFVLPLPPGVLEPSFDRKNILDGAALEGKIREGTRRLRTGENAASLLIPESCLKVFVFSFDRLPASVKEREELLRWRLNKVIPVKPPDTRISYDIIKSDGQVKVFLAMARSSVIKEYEQLYARCGMKVRAVGIPAPSLVNLLKGDEARNALIVNVEADSVSLLAVLDFEISLYRFKPFLPDALPSMLPAQKFETIVNEVENTVHFIEDREKKKVDAVWVRSAVPKSEGDLLAYVKRRTALPWRSFEPAGPPMVDAGDEQVLSPLIGQVS
jgi:Tfp pilus assembly PilM family ATPase